MRCTVVCEVAAVVEQEFGIVFADSPEANNPRYQNQVRVELKRILSSRAGRALAAALCYQLSKKGSQPASKRGTAITMTPYPFNDCAAQEDGATRGSEKSWVIYTPAQKGCQCYSTASSNLPHEKLVHELTHSLRRISGHMHPAQLKNRYNPYRNTEEFLAMLVTNIFISDVTNHYKSGLRQNYLSHSPLDKALADSHRYFSLGVKVFNIIASFCDENRGFTQTLARIPAKFNPVAAYYKSRRKVFEIAASGDAEYVFSDFVNMGYYQAPGDAAWRRVTPYPGPPARRP